MFETFFIWSLEESVPIVSAARSRPACPISSVCALSSQRGPRELEQTLACGRLPVSASIFRSPPSCCVLN